jgi:hypothetical protein
MRPDMRKSLIFASLPWVAMGLVWACSNSNGNPTIVVGNEASAGETSVPESGDFPETGPIPDVLQNPCTLADHKTDPVALCIQEQLLQFELANAYQKGQGVAPSWSSVPPYSAGTGQHAWQDDLGLAGALGAYYCSAEIYGNNQSQAPFDAALLDLGPVLVNELKQSPPPGYDGEIYFRLRWAEAAYNYVNSQNAASLAAMAETFGAGLAAQAFAVPASGGTGDAGDAGDAGGAGDGGEAGAAGSPGGTVIGAKNADGTVTYAPAQTIMAAAALLDMAVLHVKDADAGAAGAAQQWGATGLQVLDYVLARGRDPVTGLFYQSLTTSGSPGHDTPGPGTPTSDTFLTDDQAWATMGLARAQDLLVTLAAAVGDAGADAGGLDASAVTTQTYGNAGAALAASVAAAGLFDGTTTPGSPPPVGAFMEGVGPMGVLTNKTSIGNAIMLGGLHRIYGEVGTPLAYELGQTRTALLQLQPAKTSLMSVVTDSNGNPVQQSYLRAASKSFDYAVAYAPDGGAAGQEPGATDYRPAALHAMIEGFNQLWHGAPNDARCAP